MSPSTCVYTHLDGVYVLGSLAAGERSDYEHHLAGCDACARGVRELAGLPGLLGRVPAEALERTGDRDPVPPTLLTDLLTGLQTDVRRRRRRSARRSVAIAAAAVALVAGGAVAGVAVTRGDDEPPSASPSAPAVSTAPAERMASAFPDAIGGWISLTEVGWGTRIDLTCSYGSGSEATWTYVMLVRTTDGDVEEVGTWKATPGRESRVAMATSVAPDRIASVVVETADGTPVLTLE